MKIFHRSSHNQRIDPNRLKIKIAAKSLRCIYQEIIKEIHQAKSDKITIAHAHVHVAQSLNAPRGVFRLAGLEI